MSKPTPTRDEVRTKIFSSKERKSTLIPLFGTEVEIRQPTLGAILQAQEEEDRAEALINMLVDYCYVPGTNEKVFEKADKDALMEMPFGEDMVRLNKSISEMIDVDIMEEEGKG